MISRAALSIGMPGEGGLAAPSSVWAHPKAEWAADFRFHRYLVRRARRRLDDHVSVTRSSSHLIAGLDGILRSVGANQIARVEGVGAYIGGQVTNIAFPSGDGGPTLGAGFTRTLSYAPAPDGTNSAMRLQWSGSANTYQNYNQIAEADGTYTVSRWYKPLAVGSRLAVILKRSNTAWFVQADVDFSSGVVNQSSSVGSSGVTISNIRSGATLFSSGWAVVWLTCTLAGTSGANNMVAADNARLNQSGDMLAWGMDLKASPAFSPLVPTTNTSAVRYASDVRAADMSWFNGASLATSGFSVLATVNFSHVGDGVQRRIVNLSDGTTNNELRLGVDSTGLMRLSSIVSGAGQVSLPISVAPGVGRYKVAANFVQGAWYLVDSAGNSASIGTGTAPASLSEFRIGQDAGGGSFLNDTVEKLQICRPLSVSEAQAWALAA